MENFMTMSTIVYLTKTQLGVSSRGGDREFQNWMKNVMNLCYNYNYNYSYLGDTLTWQHAQSIVRND
jgi:hypothetical protein